MDPAEFKGTIIGTAVLLNCARSGIARYYTEYCTCYISNRNAFLSRFNILLKEISPLFFHFLNLLLTVVCFLQKKATGAELMEKVHYQLDIVEKEKKARPNILL